MTPGATARSLAAPGNEKRFLHQRRRGSVYIDHSLSTTLPRGGGKGARSIRSICFGSRSDLSLLAAAIGRYDPPRNEKLLTVGYAEIRARGFRAGEIVVTVSRTSRALIRETFPSARVFGVSRLWFPRGADHC